MNSFQSLMTDRPMAFTERWQELRFDNSAE